jgi:phage gpG-like protein
MTNILEFSQLKLPVLENKLDAPGRGRLLRSLAALMFAQRLVVFNTEGGPNPWKPLSPKYAAQKLRKHGGNDSKILSFSDRLKQSFTPARGAGSDEKITDDTAIISTHVEYAAIQNFGGTVLIPPSKKAQQNFKVYTSGEQEGRHRFASARDVEQGGRDFKVMSRPITVHSYGVYAKIPARPFDQFSEENTKEINQLAEAFINGKSGR